jgi:predicted DsbA family dithiol-disulfide isomerase
VPLSPRDRGGLVELVLHGDLLDPWCWIAERRIAAAAAECPGLFMPVAHAALPRRWDACAPSRVERRSLARELKRAAREPGAPPFSTELWAGVHGPFTSAPPHVAVAAARLQGPAQAEALFEALRAAALLSGIDVTRADVIVEIAARTGLDLARFVPALHAPATERALRAEVEDAFELGVHCGPSLVIGEAWLVSGLRPVREYRTLLKRYVSRGAHATAEHTVH